MERIHEYLEQAVSLVRPADPVYGQWVAALGSQPARLSAPVVICRLVKALIAQLFGIPEVKVVNRDGEVMRAEGSPRSRFGLPDADPERNPGNRDSGQLGVGQTLGERRAHLVD